MTDINELQDIAWLMGGECLSRTYAPDVLMNWQCENMHKFRLTADAVLQGKWCPFCKRGDPPVEDNKTGSHRYFSVTSGKPRKYTLTDVNKWAAEHGLKCISKKYINATSVMEWECNNGHRFSNRLSSLKNRLASLQKRYHDKKVILCTECRLDSRKCTFEGCKERSVGRKYQLCREHLDKWYIERESCKFIYFHHHNMKDDPEALSTEFLQDMFGVKCSRLEKEDKELIEKDAEEVRQILADLERDDDRDYGWRRHKKIRNINDLKSFAEYVGVEVLDDDYDPHADKPITWKCRKGHVWKRKLKTSKDRYFRHSKEFCPGCQGKYRRIQSLQDLKDMAESVDCECLSTGFDLSKRIEWRCEYGHVWENTYRTARKRLGDGVFCPLCQSGLGKHPVFNMADIKQFAYWFGLEVLSTEYVDGNDVRWKCKNGHEFDMPIRRLNYRGKYNACPVCSNRKTKNRFKEGSTKQ